MYYDSHLGYAVQRLIEYTIYNFMIDALILINQFPLRENTPQGHTIQITKKKVFLLYFIC
jgi:hypothetical protein